jgi:mannose-1-phosphate guanylyltransferase
VSTKAAVLCGGEGSRLRPLTNYFQKTMIPIGAKRRPLLEYIVKLLAYHGVKDMTLLTGYRSEEIENYFGDGRRFGARISYSRDPEPAKGSAPALAHAISSGVAADFDNLLVYYGDIISTLNVRRMLATHKARRAALTLALTRDYALPVGVASIQKGMVASFAEKPKMKLSVTIGCMVLSKATVGILQETASKREPSDLMGHFVPAVLEHKMRVAPYYVDDFWYDVGTTEAYERLDTKLVESKFKFLE